MAPVCQAWTNASLRGVPCARRGGSWYHQRTFRHRRCGRDSGSPTRPRSRRTNSAVPPSARAASRPRRASSSRPPSSARCAPAPFSCVRPRHRRGRSYSRWRGGWSRTSAASSRTGPSSAASTGFRGCRGSGTRLRRIIDGATISVDGDRGIVVLREGPQSDVVRSISVVEPARPRTVASGRVTRGRRRGLDQANSAAC